MLPMKAVRLQLGILLAANAATLAPAVDANVVALVKVTFNEDENLVAADLTLADFDGSTPIEGATGAQQTGIDPVTNQQMITIKEPLGGWRWITTGTTQLTQTIFGYALLTNDLATLLAVKRLDSPVALTAIGQEINLGTAKMTLVPQPMA